MLCCKMVPERGTNQTRTVTLDVPHLHFIWFGCVVAANSMLVKLESARHAGRKQLMTTRLIVIVTAAVLVFSGKLSAITMRLEAKTSIVQHAI